MGKRLYPSHEEFVKLKCERNGWSEEDYRWYIKAGVSIYDDWEKIPQKLICPLSFCVYCERPIRPNSSANFIRRWNKKHHNIGSTVQERRVEDSFQSYRYMYAICMGCANTEYAMGVAMEKCEELLKQTWKEIHAQTHGNSEKHSRSAPALACEPG
jgi:hypothetical protein